MKIVRIKQLSNSQKLSIVELWNTQFPKSLQLPDADSFNDYLKNISQHNFILAKNESNQIIAWAIIFTRENERWFSILIDPAYQGQGLGSELLAAAKETEKTLNGWVVNHSTEVKADGSLYSNPWPFYEKNDFELITNITLDRNDQTFTKISWVTP
ncbi:MAG: GNAT family N-acetyltransferase [Reichenbachiella sp.]